MLNNSLILKRFVDQELISYFELQVTDMGFHVAVVKLYKGDTVRWSWKDCQDAHNIVERRLVY